MTNILNIGDLAKPIDTLLQKIADATGVLYKPKQIVNEAKAEAKAKVILAKADLEIDDLQRRALNRFVQEEVKKQQNIEGIIEKSIPLLNEGFEPEKIEDDWIANFFDKCRIISDEDMQTLWAKVLAGEANEPNSFSKRTVNLLASLDKSDAEKFSALCNYVVFVGTAFPLFYDVKHKIYQKSGINFSVLKNIDSIGLVSFSDNGYGFSLNPDEILRFRYFEDELLIETKNPQLNVGKVLLTSTGQQLARICNSEPVEGFIDYLLDQWVNKDSLRVYSPFPKVMIE